jgi:hypothetical protein
VAKFEKGKSGNPGGRPKALREVDALAREHTTDALKVLAEIYKDKDTPAAARVAAINSLLDRGWGKPRQGIDLAGDPENPVQQIIQVRFVSTNR